MLDLDKAGRGSKFVPDSRFDAASIARVHSSPICALWETEHTRSVERYYSRVLALTVKISLNQFATKISKPFRYLTDNLLLDLILDSLTQPFQQTIVFRRFIRGELSAIGRTVGISVRDVCPCHTSRSVRDP